MPVTVASEMLSINDAETQHAGGEQDQPDEQCEHGQVARRIVTRPRRRRRRAASTR